MDGRIIKALSGFYYVKTDNGSVYECKAKGAFRNENITPLVGDLVSFDPSGMTGMIMDIKPRKNELIRPAVSNIDQVMVVFSVRTPNPNLSILDRFLVLMQKQNIKTIIVFNKKDLAKGDDIKNLKKAYQKSGCKVYVVSALNNSLPLYFLRKRLKYKITVMAGPSGVGKSTLLNTLAHGTTDEPTGSISSKIGRGKHTTRHNEIFQIGKGIQIADTPGFTSLLVDENDYAKEELASAFPEFAPYIPQCKFKDCNHIKAKDCAVEKAVADKKIAASRYNSYKSIYEELKSKKKF